MNPAIKSACYFFVLIALFLRPVMATATDISGLTRRAEVTIAASTTGDTTPPTAVLDESDCPDVTDLYTITGHVADSNGVEYTLSARLQGENKWDEGIGDALYIFIFEKFKAV